jgi:murein DD-endopeptidase MepM/ murein hydrolase activator NlpD
VTETGSRMPRPAMARRNPQPPSWFGSKRPWRGPEQNRRRGASVRRHAAPAFVALLLASGIGLVWPGDFRLVTAPRSGSAADAGPAIPGGSSGALVPPPLSAPAQAPLPVAGGLDPDLPPPAGVAAGEPSAAAGPASANGGAAAAGTSSDNPAPTAVDVSAAAPATSGGGPSGASPVPSGSPAASAAPAADAPPATPPATPPFAAPTSLTAFVDPADNAARRRAQTEEAPPPPRTLDGYVWPLPNGRITDPFGPSPWGSSLVDGQPFHDGVDIATFCGDRVVAAHDGVVLAAGRKFDTRIGWVGDLGPYLARLDAKNLWYSLPVTVVIDDGNGYRSIYAHFYQVVVKPGQHVKAGQFLGYEGATGHATGCHLHYGLFAPHETATFGIIETAVQHLLVPPFQIARIDPLLVLPKRAGDEEPTPVSVPNSGHDLGD